MNREENGVVKQVSLFGFAAALLVFVAVGTHAITPAMQEVTVGENAAGVLLAQSTTLSYATPAYTYRGQNGKQFTYSCPGGNAASGSIWGTDVYTDDSSVCSAGVHAGVITQAGGGTVTIEIRAGQSTYVASTRNGVTSYGYGSWSGSFAIVASASGTTDASQICPPGKTGTPPNCVSVLPPTTSCPQLMPPQCSNGTLVSNGTDSNGCSLGYTCQVTQVCPTGTTGTYPNCSPVVTATPIVTVDGGPTLAFVAGTTLLSGSATNATSLSVSVVPFNGGSAVYTNNNIAVQNGRWTFTVSPALATGSYIARISSGSTLLYNATLNVTAVAQTCPTGTTGTYPNCTTFTPVTRTTTCAPNFSLSTVWGTTIYTDDSNVCTAALHAGLIKRAEGGVVTTESRPGQASYTGSTNNGVTSYSYGSWSGSYVIKQGAQPVTTTGTLNLMYKGKALPSVSNVSKATAGTICGRVMNFKLSSYYPNSSCVWNGQPIEFDAASGTKDGDPYLRFIKPVPGQNETISIGGTYTVTVDDPSLLVNSLATVIGKYRVYLHKFTTTNGSDPENVYEANIQSAERSGSSAYLKWNFTVDNSPVQIPAGNYYFSAVNTDNGLSGTVSAYTYLVDSTATTQTPIVSVDGGPVLAFVAGTTLLSGSATNATTLSVNIVPLSGGSAVYTNNSIAVVNGRWTFTVLPALASGSYIARISSGSTLLYNATLNVTAPTTSTAQSTVCTYTSSVAPSPVPKTATVSQSNTIDLCKAACVVIKNEVYGLGDSGVCKFTDAAGAVTPMNIGAAVTPAPANPVQVIVSVANVRNNPSATAVIGGTQSYGAKGSVSNPSTTADGYTWYLVDFESGVDGWTVASNISFTSTPTATPIVSVDGGATISSTSATPTFNGGATNAPVLNATIEPLGSAPISSISNIVVSSGRWSFAAPTLANGQYIVRIYSGSTLLYNVSLTVAVTSAPQTCPSGTTGTYPNCAVIETGTGQFSTQVVVSVANVRTNPSATATIAGTHAMGNMGVIVGGPVNADGYTWYQVDFNSGVDGWTVSSNIQVPSNAPTTTTTTTTNTTDTTTTTVQTCPIGTTGSYPDCVQAQTSARFLVAGRVATVGGSNVRTGASLTSAVVGLQATGALGSVIAGPVAADGYLWYQINFDVGVDGWTIQDNLQASTIQLTSTTSTTGQACTGVAGTWSAPAGTGPIPSIYQVIQRWMRYDRGGIEDTAAAAVGTQFTYSCLMYPGSAYLPNSYQLGLAYKGPNGTWGVNSDICNAAIKSGIITASVGGTIKIERVAPQLVYADGVSTVPACTPVPAFKFVTSAYVPGAETMTPSATSGAAPLNVSFSLAGLNPQATSIYNVNAPDPTDSRYNYTANDNISVNPDGTSVRSVTLDKPGTYVFTLGRLDITPTMSGSFSGNDYLPVKTVTITVTAPASGSVVTTPPPPSCSIGAYPSLVPQSGYTTLIWTSSNAWGASINPAQSGAGIQQVIRNGSLLYSAQGLPSGAKKTYTLTVQDVLNRTATCSTEITVQ